MLEKITLPGTELRVSSLCLGTNMFGSALEPEQAAAILETFFAAGGNFIDTAHSYGDWVPGIPLAASERSLRTLLAGRPRTSYVLATKGCEFDYRKGDFALRVTPELLQSDLADSLETLGVDCIDLYWLHRDDPSRPVGVIVDALIAAQQAGRIRHFGCSNWSVARIQEAQRYAAGLGHPGFVACQPMWGLAVPDREAMQRFAPGGYYEDGYHELHAAGMPMIPYSGQSRGVFSKLAERREAAITEDVKALYCTDTNRRKLVVLRELAQRHGTSINAVVLAYLCSQPLTTIPIIGASSARQLQESIAAAALRLDAAELAALRTA